MIPRTLPLLLLAVLAVAPARAQAPARAVPVFAQGAPVLVEFRYAGGIEGWDGSVSVAERDGAPRLVLANGAFLVLARGEGPFAPPDLGNRTDVEPWETRSPRRGVLVPPRRGRVERPAYGVALREPFAVVVDLARFYVMETPGVYRALWGVEGVWEEEILFVVAGD